MICVHHKEDYRWQEASRDAHIHSNIYQNINEAKYIAYAMPPFTVSYSLKYKKIVPGDFFGSEIGEVDIYDPNDYATWYERADVEIPRYLKSVDKKFIVIKGYGIYAYNRDLRELAKDIALIENSCKVLHYNSVLGNCFDGDLDRFNI